MSTKEEREHDKAKGGGPIKGRDADKAPIRRPTPAEARAALGEKPTPERD